MTSTCPTVPLGRPPGEVRQVLLSILRSAGPLCMRDAAQRAQIGIDAAQRAMDNALRSGAVQVVGHEKRAHCKRWVAIYQVVDTEPPAVAPEPEAAHALITLSRFWHGALG